MRLDHWNLRICLPPRLSDRKPPVVAFFGLENPGFSSPPVNACKPLTAKSDIRIPPKKERNSGSKKKARHYDCMSFHEVVERVDMGMKVRDGAMTMSTTLAIG